MNKKLLALSLVAAPGLMAQEASESTNAHEQTGYCNTCCCSPCCCKPCCVPKPKKCIDCECYTPAFYDLQCDCGFFFDVEFLYWYAGETDLSYALKAQSTPRTDQPVIPSTLVFAPQNYKSINTKWDPGFRIGIGWNSECDGWDYYLNWTYYCNKSSNSTSVPDTYNQNGDFGLAAEGQEFLLNPWINQSFHGINPNSDILTFDKISAKWRLTFNQVDLELGRKYWLSRCFNLRPYTGLRGAWTRTNFRTKSFRDFSDGLTTYDIDFSDKFKSRTWGVGFLGGIQPTWYFCDNFALYSNMDVALLWGDFEVKKSESYVCVTDQAGTVTIDPNYSNSSTNKFSQMHALLDVAIGLRWEEYWCCDQYRSNLDLGWEHHIWLNHNHRNKTYDYFASPGATTLDPSVDGFRQYDEATGDLGLGGLVIRLRFDW
ncbi:MAG: Lpg1974 family pore-forming outer membrane protein [Simkaniaceae bacterium]|nr:Lpg1974 family pore-forming outer membrane protein [Candidatus Sacchlamyda saccharinae]